MSDTHGYIDEHILKFCREADEIWHGGDWGQDVNEKLEALKKPIQGVYGNIDGQKIRAIYPEICRFECEGIHVLIKHIGGYPGHYAAGVKADLIKEKPDLSVNIILETEAHKLLTNQFEGDITLPIEKNITLR